MSRIAPHLLFAALLLVLTLVLLLWFARPEGGLAEAASDAYEAPLDGFVSPGGPVALTGHGVRADRADASGVTLLIHSFPPRAASGFRYLQFRLTGIPPLSRPILVWSDGSGLRLAALPATPSGGGTIDLAQLPQWQGEVSQVGIALMPNDLLAPSLLPDTSLEVQLLRLEPPGWGGALRNLWTEWTAVRSWNGRSNNTLGLESGRREASLPGFLALWLVGAMALLLLCHGRQSLHRHAVALVVAACVLLALLQVRQLAANASIASAAARQATRAQPLSAAPALAAAAVELNQRLREAADRPRVLVHGDGLFLSEYPTWLLRESNAATLRTPDWLPPQASLEGWVLVLVGDGDWRFDAGSGELTVGNQQRQALPWFESGPLRAYRFAAAGDRP